MAESWQISGDYFESCSCEFVCPCVASNMSAMPTKGSCSVGLAFHIDRGHYGDVQLDGLNFALLVFTPGVMGTPASWKVGLILDERSDEKQGEAITAIASGQGGGPMANLGPLLGEFLGVERASIDYQKDGLKRSVKIAEKLDLAIEAVESAVKPGEPVQITNTLHPANSTLALAKASRAHLNGFGLSWDDASGKNNGHSAPIEWAG
jgi:hypothetical protein